MKVILCGYHWTGCKALELLLSREHEVFVYTHASKYSVADLEGLCIRKNVRYSLKKININNLPFVPDIICSVYYRYIIDKEIIEIVDGKIFNLHPALLPKYRGCSSLTWAMINNERECGYTFHYVDEMCDTGNIIVQKKMQIEDFDTQLTLYNRVMFEAMGDFLQAFDLVCSGYKGTKQFGASSYYGRGCPLSGTITMDMDDEMKERFIRAMVYPPYPKARINGEEIENWCEYLRRFR